MRRSLKQCACWWCTRSCVHAVTPRSTNAESSNRAPIDRRSTSQRSGLELESVDFVAELDVRMHRLGHHLILLDRLLDRYKE
jgi:hypothetical protein